MNWKRLPALTEGAHIGCLNCGQRPSLLPMDALVAVGFGDAHVERDGEIIYSETASSRRFARVSRFETMAAKEPRHDWRIVLDGPLHGETYQRHGVKKWVLVKRNRGFA